jgi:hypothetical protein
MKKISIAILLLLTVLVFAISCSPEASYTSPLKGVRIGDLTFEAYETTKNVEVSTRLDEVEATVTDTESDEKATWLEVTVKKTSLDLKLTENVSVKDRKALVQLKYKGTLSSESDATVDFYVIQKRNKMFEDFDVQEVLLDYRRADTTVVSRNALRNVTAETVDMYGNPVTWCTVKVMNSEMFIKVTENKNKHPRQAIAKLFPNVTNAALDNNIVKSMFLITQEYNPILDNLKIHEVELPYEESKKVIHTDRVLDGIRAFATDEQTQQRATWCTVGVAGDSITLRTQKLNSKSDRSAVVTLYLPNNGEVIDSTTITASFKFRQIHNGAIESLVIEDQTLDYNQTTDTVYVGRNLKGFRCEMTDTRTNLAPNWLQAQVGDSIIVFKTSVNDAINDRSAKVTLYQPNGNVIDDNTIQCSFLFLQQAKRHLKPEVSSIETDYSRHSVKVKITSNVKYQIEKENDGIILGCTMTPIDDLHEEIDIEVSENTTESKRTSTLTLRSGDLATSISISQLTNPEIIFMDGYTKTLTFNKAKGEFNLNISTLTPDYKITKGGNWISIGEKVREDVGKYSHRIVVNSFTGQGPLRTDTITMKNFGQEKKLAIVQHKFIYLSDSEIELEEGEQYQLSYQNYSGQTVVWRTKNANNATVSQSGLVKAVGAGRTSIEASIGSYYDLDDYFDACIVTVYQLTDKVAISRGSGDYLKNGDYVTADCPITITNNYHSDITISSVTLTGNNGTYSQMLSSTAFSLKKDGDSRTFNISSFDHVHKPVITVKITCKGKNYTKTAEY